MGLLEEPYQIKDSTVKYYAYKHPRVFACLNLLLCPLTCGLFWCWTTPLDRVVSDMRYDGLPVHKRMADTHFAREGRKVNRRNSLSDLKPVGRFTPMFKRKKQASEQTQSALFSKLPVEIRVEIFKQVLFDTGAVCIDTVRINPDVWYSFHKIRARDCNVKHSILPGHDNSDPVGILVSESRLDIALLRTCRLVYIEALPILYAQTQFVFQDPRHLVAFSQCIPQTHLQHIRSIRMEFSQISSVYVRERRKTIYTFKIPLYRPMKDFLGVIRLMQRLQSVYITFDIQGWRSHLYPDLDEIVGDMQEYQERIRKNTTTQCRLHLVVYRDPELVFQRTERGWIDPEQTRSEIPSKMDM